jgi:hypothetical protein
MKRLYFQTGRFNATPAQLRVLRAIHRGEPFETNGATRARLHRLLDFSVPGKVTVKPEIVQQLHLDQ